MYSPAQVSSSREAQAACRAWRPSAAPIWWDSLAELDAVVAQTQTLNSWPPVVMTDLQCKGWGQGGSNVLPGMPLSGGASCSRLSTGQAVPQQLLAWYKLAGNGDGASYEFEPTLYVQPADDEGSVTGLIGGAWRMAGALLCRDGGGQQPLLSALRGSLVPPCLGSRPARATAPGRACRQRPTSS
jgi:hypothetical protein